MRFLLNSQMIVDEFNGIINYTDEVKITFLNIMKKELKCRFNLLLYIQ